MRNLKLSLFILCFLLFLPALEIHGQEKRQKYIPLRAAVHVHTNFSCGNLTPQEICDLAREQGLDAVLFSDHDQRQVEYGVPFINRLVKFRKTHPSVFRAGVENYFKTMNELQVANPDIVIVAGTEATVHYYWTGIPEKNLELRNFRKHMLLFGMSEPRDYAKAPVMHSGFSLRYWRQQLPAFLIALTVLLIAIGMWKKWKKKLFLSVAVFAAFSVINYLPIQNGPFGTHSDPGAAPYQAVIDYTNEKGGIVLWAHPEASQKPQAVYGAHVMAESYLDLIEETYGVHAIPVLYGDTTTAEKPGKLWDQLLNDYLQGKRPRPVFGFGEIDYNGRTKDPIDFEQTVFLVKEKSREGLMEAMRHGRMYAVDDNARYSLDIKFEGIDKDGAIVQMGDTMKVGRAARFAISARYTNESHDNVTVIVIRNGEVIHREEQAAPMENFIFEDPSPPAKSFYRIWVKTQHGVEAMSNPIFVHAK